MSFTRKHWEISPLSRTFYFIAKIYLFNLKMILLYFHENTVYTHLGFSCRSWCGRMKVKGSALWVGLSGAGPSVAAPWAPRCVLCRTLAASRSGFCWAAAASPWPWPRMLVRRACPRHRRERWRLSKVGPQGQGRCLQQEWGPCQRPACLASPRFRVTGQRHLLN